MRQTLLNKLPAERKAIFHLLQGCDLAVAFGGCHLSRRGAALMTLTREQATDTLQALVIEALTRERENHLGAQALRTVEHALPHATLKVSALYDAETENRIILWATATLEKALAGRKLPVHIAYYCDWEGHRVNLSREGALTLLTEGDLPDEVKDFVHTQSESVVAQVLLDRDDAALFASLNRIDRHEHFVPNAGPRRPSTARLLPPSGRSREEIQEWMYHS